jgi:hypothetical protein
VILVEHQDIRPHGSVRADEDSRVEYVLVSRDLHTYPGALVAWRRERDPDGSVRRSALVVYLDAHQTLRESWFPETSVIAVRDKPQLS